MELGAADGNKATNPNNTHGSDDSDESESDDLETSMALDKQITRATQTRDCLLKQRQLENINQQIKALEQGHQADSNGGPMSNPPIEIHTTGSKRPLNKALIQASKRRNIKLKKLLKYHSKSR